MLIMMHSYEKTFNIDVTVFKPMVSRPGEPHDTVDVTEVQGTKIDSAFIGSCTNGRMKDMYKAAAILKNRKVAPGVVLKIVPATDEIWKQCLDKGLIRIFQRMQELLSQMQDVQVVQPDRSDRMVRVK